MQIKLRHGNVRKHADQMKNAEYVCVGVGASARVEEKINTCISTWFYVRYFLFSRYIFKLYTTNDKQPTSKNTFNVNTIIASIRIAINRPTTTINVMLQFYVHCSNELCKWDKKKKRACCSLNSDKFYVKLRGLKFMH